MDKKTKALEFFKKEFGFDGYEKAPYTLDGKEVYVSTFNRPVYIGYPYFFIVEGNEVRLASDSESDKLFKKYRNS